LLTVRPARRATGRPTPHPPDPSRAGEADRRADRSGSFLVNAESREMLYVFVFAQFRERKSLQFLLKLL